MKNTKVKRVKGVVLESLPGTTFKVQLEDGIGVYAYLSGKMRLNFIKVLPGDSVLVEINDYGSGKGRIVQRL